MARGNLWTRTKRRAETAKKRYGPLARERDACTDKNSIEQPMRSCGVGGCAKKFRSFTVFKRHMREVHEDHYAAAVWKQLRVVQPKVHSKKPHAETLEDEMQDASEPEPEHTGAIGMVNEHSSEGTSHEKPNDKHVDDNNTATTMPASERSDAEMSDAGTAGAETSSSNILSASSKPSQETTDMSSASSTAGTPAISLAQPPARVPAISNTSPGMELVVELDDSLAKWLFTITISTHASDSKPTETSQPPVQAATGTSTWSAQNATAANRPNTTMTDLPEGINPVCLLPTNQHSYPSVPFHHQNFSNSPYGCQPMNSGSQPIPSSSHDQTYITSGNSDENVTLQAWSNIDQSNTGSDDLILQGQSSGDSATYNGIGLRNDSSGNFEGYLSEQGGNFDWEQIMRYDQIDLDQGKWLPWQ